MIRGFQPSRISTWPLRLKFAFGLISAALIELALVAFSLILVSSSLPSGADQVVLSRLAAVLLAIWLPGLALLALSWSLIGVYVLRPLRQLNASLAQLIQGGYTQRLPLVDSADEIGQVIIQFNTVYDHFGDVQASLGSNEQQRAHELETVRDITRAVVSGHDVHVITDQVIDLLCERFPHLYQAQVFLLNDEGDEALIEASSGSAGKRPVEQRQRWAVGSHSLVGQALTRRTTMVAFDMSNHPLYPINPLLPDSQSECALPIQVGSSLIGVLNLHSHENQAFNETELSLYQIVADQLANAIYNAQFFEEMQMRMDQVEALNQQLTGRAWRTYTQNRSQTGASVQPEPLSHLQQQAVNSGQIATEDETEQTRLAVPIQLRGATLGAIEWTVPNYIYSAALGGLAEELAARFALTADNVRLLDQTQRQVQRERLINNISAQLTQQSDISQILQTAIRELGQALPVSQAVIEIDKEQT